VHCDIWVKGFSVSEIILNRNRESNQCKINNKVMLVAMMIRSLDIIRTTMVSQGYRL
jgi:hypothetical protein